MKVTRLTGWVGAVSLVLGVHAATALWVMNVRPDIPDSPGQPIFVDLAPPPPGADFSTPESGEAQPSPPEEKAEAEPPAPEPPEAEPPPPEETAAVEPEPEPEPETPVTDPLPELETAEAVLSSAARPEPRPKVQPKPKKVVQREPEKKKKPAEVKERRQPQKTASSENRAVRSTAANRPAAEASGDSTGAGVKAEANWRAKASAVVARHMQRGRYTVSSPVSAVIRLSVDGSGQIVTASVSSPAGGAIDEALSRQINRLGRLPPPPGGRPVSAAVSVKVTR